MQALIRFLVLASISLYTYGAAASLPGFSIYSESDNDSKIALQDTSNYQHLASQLNSTKASINNRVDSLHNILLEQQVAQKSNSEVNLDVYSKDKKLGAIETTIDQNVEALIKEVPLPATIWLFLAGFIGFLRIHRNRTYH